MALNSRRSDENTFDELREGLRSLGPARWAEIFGTSVTDLRDLLHVARDREVLLLGRILDGDTVRIPVDVFDPSLVGAVSISGHDDETLFGPLRLTSGGTDVADIPTRHQAELSALLEIGLPHVAIVEQVHSGWELTISLGDT